MISDYNLTLTMTANLSQDAKKDEIRKYLEKAGVLELLTKSLVQLYEVPLQEFLRIYDFNNFVPGARKTQ